MQSRTKQQELCGNRLDIYSFSSERRRALAFVTLIESCWARSTIAFLFLLETLCAISAENVLFCIIRTSSSWKYTAKYRSAHSIGIIVILKPPLKNNRIAKLQHSKNCPNGMACALIEFYMFTINCLSKYLNQKFGLPIETANFCLSLTDTISMQLLIRQWNTRSK